MLQLALIDLSAASRHRMLEQLSALLNRFSRENQVVPQLSIKPMAPEEIRFQLVPDICLLGPEAAERDPGLVSFLRTTFAGCAILVLNPSESLSLDRVEYFARLGADDVICKLGEGTELLKRLVFLARKQPKKKSGKLLLIDGGKGGSGVSSICAAIGDSLSAFGAKALVVDLDTESQDLSRFLLVRPFFNENLDRLLSGRGPITRESALECTRAVWSDDVGFHCMPPPSDWNPTEKSLLSTWQRILEFLDEEFACIIVDCSGATLEQRHALYAWADSILFVVNNDPASLYASGQRILSARELLGVETKFLILENRILNGGIPSYLLREELNLSARLNPGDWSSPPLSFSLRGARWPGSGATLYSLSSRSQTHCYHNILQSLELLDGGEVPQDFGYLQKVSSFLRQRFSARLTSTEATLALDRVSTPLSQGERKQIAMRAQSVAGESPVSGFLSSTNVRVMHAQENIVHRRVSGDLLVAPARIN